MIVETVGLGTARSSPFKSNVQRSKHRTSPDPTSSRKLLTARGNELSIKSLCSGIIGWRGLTAP
jgi:hypothetical protein